MDKVAYACSTHGQDIIPTRDTTEHWDYHAQMWIVNNDSARPYCPECGSDLEEQTAN